MIPRNGPVNTVPRRITPCEYPLVSGRFDRRTFVRGATIGVGGLILGSAPFARAADPLSGDFFVDRAVGSDANPGTTPDAPFRTIGLARAGVLSAGRPCRIFLSGGSENAPYQEWVSQLSSLEHSLLIRPLADSGQQWLSGGSAIASTATWTNLGGGVYSTPNARPGPTSLGIMWCSDEARNVTIGGRTYPLKLRQTRGTQSAPKTGEYGETGGLIYVKLPGLTSPAGSGFWLTKLPRAFNVHSNAETALVTFERLRFRGFRESGVLLGSAQAPAGTGYVDHVDCQADMCGYLGGFAATGVWSRSRSYRCISERHSNDGFNYHSTAVQRPLAQEHDCVGRANGDTTADSAQGTGLHENTRLQIFGGDYSYNISGGLVAIGTPLVELRNSTANGPPLTMTGNQRSRNQGGIHAGLGISGSAQATVFDAMSVTASGGSNVKVAASATLTGYELITSTGGGALDDLAA